jgi:hypothetical protein
MQPTVAVHCILWASFFKPPPPAPIMIFCLCKCAWALVELWAVMVGSTTTLSRRLLGVRLHNLQSTWCAGDSRQCTSAMLIGGLPSTKGKDCIVTGAGWAARLYRGIPSAHKCSMLHLRADYLLMDSLCHGLLQWKLLIRRDEVCARNSQQERAPALKSVLHSSHLPTLGIAPEQREERGTKAQRQLRFIISGVKSVEDNVFPRKRPGGAGAIVNRPRRKLHAVSQTHTTQETFDIRSPCSI